MFFQIRNPDNACLRQSIRELGQNFYNLPVSAKIVIFGSEIGLLTCRYDVRLWSTFQSRHSPQSTASRSVPSATTAPRERLRVPFLRARPGTSRRMPHCHDVNLARDISCRCWRYCASRRPCVSRAASTTARRSTSPTTQTTSRAAG